MIVQFYFNIIQSIVQVAKRAKLIECVLWNFRYSSVCWVCSLLPMPVLTLDHFFNRNSAAVAEEVAVAMAVVHQEVAQASTFHRFCRRNSAVAAAVVMEAATQEEVAQLLSK